DCGRGRRWRGRRSNPRESPGWRGIPQILNRGIVVQVYSIDEGLTSDQAIICITYVRIVETEMVRLCVIGRLDESAEMCGVSASKKQRDILRNRKTPVLSAILGTLGSGVGNLEPRGQREIRQ